MHVCLEIVPCECSTPDILAISRRPCFSINTSPFAKISNLACGKEWQKIYHISLQVLWKTSKLKTQWISESRRLTPLILAGDTLPPWAARAKPIASVGQTPGRHGQDAGHWKKKPGCCFLWIFDAKWCQVDVGKSNMRMLLFNEICVPYKTRNAPPPRKNIEKWRYIGTQDD